jgi:dynein heavy chain, axonemal
LNLVVKDENSTLAMQREKGIEEFFANKKKLKDTETKILKMLKEAEGEILDNEELIETLKRSKVESTEISDKL